MQITRHTMQLLIQSLKLSLTISRAKFVYWALELKTTCRISALRRRTFYLQPFPQFHLGFSNALTVTSVYAVTIIRLLTQKCLNANSLSFAQSFHAMYLLWLRSSVARLPSYLCGGTTSRDTALGGIYEQRWALVHCTYRLRPSKSAAR